MERINYSNKTKDWKRMEKTRTERRGEEVSRMDLKGGDIYE